MFPYNFRTTNYIEDAFRKSKTEIAIVVKGITYVIDFLKMIQRRTDRENATERTVQRRDLNIRSPPAPVPEIENTIKSTVYDGKFPDYKLLKDMYMNTGGGKVQ